MRIASDQITVETGRRRIRRTLHLARWTGLLLIAAASLSAQNGGEKGLISEQMLWPHLRGHVKILGNRLLTKGKERAVLGGAIVRSAGSHNVTVAVAIDGRIRIDEQNAPSIGHDGNASWHAQGNVTSDESDLLETLVNDTAEHFFLSHARSVPGRFYGSRFRTDDGTNPNYKGPYYDIYEMVDKVVGTTTSRTRVYCLNSETMLLEKIQYRITRAGAPVSVETVLSGWKDFQGEKFPTKVSHTENGREVFAITYSSAQVLPDAADGAFQKR